MKIVSIRQFIYSRVVRRTMFAPQEDEVRSICFHGRRALDMSGDFLLAAQVLGDGAGKAGLSVQVRTPMWPSPPGVADRALVKIDTATLKDLNIPDRYDLEVVCDPTLAVIPPMGGALLPGGTLFANTPSPPETPSGTLRVISSDLEALAAAHGASLGFALAGAAWSLLGAIAEELVFDPKIIEAASPPSLATPPGDAEINLLRETQKIVTALLSEPKSG